MTKYLLSLAVLIASPVALASLNLFKDEDGRTNWQHLANWTSGTLIIILSIVLIHLFRVHRKVRRSNTELKAIRNHLELRVRERTVTLDQSNRQLTKINKLLETEVQEHLHTTDLLKGSEAYIKDVLASMPLVLVSLDSQGNVTHWNRRAEQASSIPASEAIGNYLWDVYPAITLTWQQVEEVMDKGEVLNFSQSQKGMYHFDITLYPLQSSGERGVVILVDDVSSQKRAEQVLVHNDKMSMMNELASAMAHDINIPLQAILLDLQSFHKLMERGSLLEGQAGGDLDKSKQLLADASERGQQVASIVSNLLDFSRGRNDMAERVDVVQLLDNTLALAREVLSLPGGVALSALRIERDYADHLPLLNCHVTEFQQVLLSLLRQACQAIDSLEQSSEQGWIKLSVEEQHQALWLRISHNGALLTEEQQTHLFESALGEGQQGELQIGERLSFAHHIIVDQHQGHLAVTCDESSGVTTFHIQLLIE